MWNCKMMDITKWAEDLTEEVYNEWKTKYSFWKDGFEVFYSPVRYRPELMIISLNPGGGEKDFQALDFPKFQGGNFSVPKQNRYVTTLAGVCRKTFVELFVVKLSFTQGTSNQNFFWQDSHPLDEKYY